MSSAASAGTWWAYAEGNGTILGVVVGLVALAAFGFVGRRALEQRKRRRR